MEYFIDLCKDRQAAAEMIHTRRDLEKMTLIHDSGQKAALVTLSGEAVDEAKIVLVFRKG